MKITLQDAAAATSSFVNLLLSVAKENSVRVTLCEDVVVLEGETIPVTETKAELWKTILQENDWKNLNKIYSEILAVS